MRAATWALAVLAGLAAVTLITAGVGLHQMIYARGPDGPEIELKVPKGATKLRVGQLLHDEGLIPSMVALKVWLKIGPGVPAPKAGLHRVHARLNVPELYAVLAENPIPEDTPVTLVEGWRLSDADEALASQGRLTPGTYQEAASSTAGYELAFPVEGTNLAGYLLPDTYMMPAGPIEPRALVQRQLDAFAKRFYLPHREEIARGGRTLRTVVILASLLEREEPKPEVRPKVAGVLYNRLDAGTPLGVDATSRYTLDDWSDRRAFLKKLRDPKDPWNTRLRAGLPPGPIGAPSLQSLTAALRPERSKNWYYLHDKNQQIHFSRTAGEHEAKRHKYNVW